MKKLVLLTIVIALCKVSSAQITKHNWLVGGTAFFNSTNYNSEAEANYQKTEISASPNIGYFIANKFAAGLKLSYINEKYQQKANNTVSKNITYSTGPFVRYYFLPASSQFNLLVDASYQFGVEKGGGGSNTYDYELTKYNKHLFSCAAGPVVYFNSSVGLEFLFGYTNTKIVGHDGNDNEFQMGLGLQVHLKK